jgi:protein TonB
MAFIRKRRVVFTIYYAFAVSLALHAALSMPIAIYGVMPQETAEPLVVELQGAVSDDQADEKVLEQVKAAEKPPEPETEKAEAVAPPPVEPQPEQTVHDDGELPPPPPQTPPAPARAEQKIATADAKNVTGVEQQQEARRIQSLTETQRINIYVRALSKRVQTHLIYPEEGRRTGLKGTATISFTILNTGHIRPESLKITESSGQPKLDESALKTIRASVPFAPPPREMTIAIAVDFGPRR